VPKERLATILTAKERGDLILSTLDDVLKTLKLPGLNNTLDQATQWLVK
jgi:2-phospho-L-lactate guanylyltransferase (CobY/MobA/RfbA family)